MLEWLHRTRTGLDIALQVGEGFAEIALVEHGATYRVIFTKRLEILPKLFARTQVVEKLAQALLAAPEVVQGTVRLRDARIQCVLVHPLSRCADKESLAELKDDARITKSLLRRVLKDGVVVKDDAVQIPDEYAVYSEHVTEVRLNGYTTDNPLGKEARHVVVVVRRCFTTDTVWQSTATVLERIFNREVTFAHADVVIDVTRPTLVAALCTPSPVAAELDSVLLLQ